MADADSRITLTVTARVGESSNVLCGGAANPDELAQQLESASVCPTCSPFTDQVAITFGREAGSP